MQIENRKTMLICPFEDYLRIPAWSYSGIKLNGVEKFEPTEKMKLGTHVHNYLLTPGEYQYDDIDTVKPIATKLRQTIGDTLMQYLEPEVVITCDMVHEGFRMKYKGRLDLRIYRRIVIDIKITSVDIRKAVAFFGYDIQQTGYALGNECDKAFIVAIHPTKLATQIYNVPLNPSWWESQVKQKGEPIL